MRVSSEARHAGAGGGGRGAGRGGAGSRLDDAEVEVETARSRFALQRLRRRLAPQRLVLVVDKKYVARRLGLVLGRLGAADTPHLDEDALKFF